MSRCTERLSCCLHLEALSGEVLLVKSASEYSLSGIFLFSPSAVLLLSVHISPLMSFAEAWMSLTFCTGKCFKRQYSVYKRKWKWSRSVVSDSLRPHGLQPTRLLRPWDFPGKSTGVGCHRLLRSLVQSWVEIMSLSHKPLDSYFKQKWRPSAGSETWCFSFTISPPKEYSGFISFRTDWFHLSLTCIQVFQEAGKVVCFSHPLKNLQ